MTMRCALTKAKIASAVVSRVTTGARWMSSSITYSGGQASEGQGGFYGSGGARATGVTQSEYRPEFLALAGDVQIIQQIMTEVETLESLLDDSISADQTAVITGKSIEVRANIKKLMTSSEFMECLNRLEAQGEPVWGLNTSERDLITAARAKMNDC